MLLLLFDIDGTLLQRASVEHALALRTAAGAVHGVDLLGVDGVDYAGRTDRAITRDLLAAVGVSEVDDAWVDACVTEYERRCPADLSAKVAPGMVELLEELAARPDEFRLALVTGNLEPVARIKLAAAGIGHYFEPGQGGFGSDDEDRGRLPAIAREPGLVAAVVAGAHGGDRRHAAGHPLRAGGRGARGGGGHGAVCG